MRMCIFFFSEVVSDCLLCQSYVLSLTIISVCSEICFNEYVLRLVTLCYLCVRFEGEREGRENTQYDNGKVMGM